MDVRIIFFMEDWNATGRRTYIAIDLKAVGVPGRAPMITID